MKRLKKLLLAGLLVTHFWNVSAGQTRTSSEPATTASPAPELKHLLERAGRRVQQYHDAMFSLAMTEVVKQQELRSDSRPKGRPRTLVYESVVLSRPPQASQPKSVPVITRTLKSVDGKPPRPQSLQPRSKCVDTNPPSAYGDPLAFLLPENQPRLLFSYEGEADLQGRKTAVVSFTSPPAPEPVKLVEKGDCFFLSRALRRKGEIWIDRESYEVLQLRWQLAETFNGKGRRKELRYEKSVFVVRFRPVTFQNPEQTLLLPTSSESIWVLKGARIAGFQTITEYTRYRRFVSSVEVKESDEEQKQ